MSYTFDFVEMRIVNDAVALMVSASIGQAPGGLTKHLGQASRADDSLQAAARLLDVAPRLRHLASRYSRVSHFDLHRHHGAGCVLVGIEVDDELKGCKAISLRRIKVRRRCACHLRELSAQIVRERLPLPVIGVGAHAFSATPPTATRVLSAAGVQQATQTGCRLGFDR